MTISTQIHAVVTNWMFAVPIAMVLTAMWLMFLKQKEKGTRLSNNFILKNCVFVGALVAAIVILGKPLPPLEDRLFVGPADF